MIEFGEEILVFGLGL